MASDSKAQNRARARAWTWPGIWPGPGSWPAGGTRAAPGISGPRSGFFTATKLRQWAAEEVATAHLLLWLAVAYGFGVVLYFTADHEPAWWAGIGVALVSAGFAVVLRRNLVAFVLALLDSRGLPRQKRRGAETAETTIATPVIDNQPPGAALFGIGRDRRRLCRAERRKWESQHADRTWTCICASRCLRLSAAG